MGDEPWRGKSKLDRNLGVEIERRKAFIERETSRLVSLEESGVRLVTELSQRQQELDKQKEVEELRKATATDTELPDMAVDSENLGRACHGHFSLAGG